MVGPFDHLEVVEAVTGGDGPLVVDAELRLDECEPTGLRHPVGGDVEPVAPSHGIADFVEPEPVDRLGELLRRAVDIAHDDAGGLLRQQLVEADDVEGVGFGELPGRERPGRPPVQVRVLDEEEGRRQHRAHALERGPRVEGDDVVHLPPQRQRGIELDDDRAVRAHDETLGESERPDDLEGSRQRATGRDDDVVPRLGEVDEHLPHRLRQRPVIVDDRAVDVEGDEVCGHCFSLAGGGAAQNRGPSGPWATMPPR